MMMIGLQDKLDWLNSPRSSSHHTPMTVAVLWPKFSRQRERSEHDYRVGSDQARYHKSR